MFICDRGFEAQSRGLMATAAVKVDVRVISAGKFRRYAHLSALQHLTVPHVVTRNTADVFRVGKGVMQSIQIIRRFDPDIVFAKGGFVCLPVAIAAKLRRIPLVIHDSDTRPGLTNSIISRWADAIATGAPLDNYPYDPAISHYTGVPIGEHFTPVSPERQSLLKQKLGFSADEPLVVATGGGLGAKSINEGMIAAVDQLRMHKVNAYIVTGRGHYDDVVSKSPKSKRLKITPFVYEHMVEVLGAADIVVCRGSATTPQELAGLKKAVVIVPAHQLSDQVKNAEVFKAAEAGVVLDNQALITSPEILGAALIELISNPAERKRLAENLHSFARPHAARDVAELIERTARSS